MVGFVPVFFYEISEKVVFVLLRDFYDGWFCSVTRFQGKSVLFCYEFSMLVGYKISMLFGYKISMAVGFDPVFI